GDARRTAGPPRSAVPARAAGADLRVVPGPGPRPRPRHHRSRQPRHDPGAAGLLDPPPGTARGPASRPRASEEPTAPAVLRDDEGWEGGTDGSSLLIRALGSVAVMSTDHTPHPSLTLQNGVHIPALGLGVFQTAPEETAAAVSDALRLGYRLIATSASYGNEREVGPALRASDVDRSAVFLETKLWIMDYGY